MKKKSTTLIIVLCCMMALFFSCDSGGGGGSETAAFNYNPSGTIPEGAWFGRATGIGQNDKPPLNLKGEYPVGKNFIPSGGGFLVYGMHGKRGPGEQFPVLQDFDFLIYGDYVYIYANAYGGWYVFSTFMFDDDFRAEYDKVKYYDPATKADVGPMVETICGYPVAVWGPVFFQRKLMTEAPPIPDNLTAMFMSFYGTGLTVAPRIPDGVELIDCIFEGCKNLVSVPYPIPSSVTSMHSAFRDCYKLEGDITINADPSVNDFCFLDAGRDGSGIVLKGSSTKLDALAATKGTYGKVTVAP